MTFAVEAHTAAWLLPSRLLPPQVEYRGRFRLPAGELDELPGLRGLEINLASAEPLEHEYPEMVRTARVEAIVSAARTRTGLPLLAELPPQTSDVHSLARAAELAGADAIVLVDALRGMKIDTWTGRPVLGGGWGGLSGPAIHPIAVWLVYQASKAVTVPVIGMGGISSTEDALEFILAGATAVEVGTTTFVEPRTAMTIADELPGMMVARGYTSLASAVSRSHQAASPDAMA
ncbi:MAG: hypothetical protein HY534_06525 [Chloroflexi bacterium]|nr:hypothetical protein [Chloroflexota bacterium]